MSEFDDIVEKAAVPPEPWDERNAAERIKEIVTATGMDSFLASLCTVLSIEVEPHYKHRDIQRMIYRRIQRLQEENKQYQRYSNENSWREGTYQNGL